MQRQRPSLAFSGRSAWFQLFPLPGVSSPRGFFCFFPGFLSYSEQMTLLVTKCVQQSRCSRVFIWIALALFGGDRLMFCCLRSLCDGALSQYHTQSVSLAVVKKRVFVVCSTVGQNWLEIPNVITELLCELVSVFPSL